MYYLILLFKVSQIKKEYAKILLIKLQNITFSKSHFKIENSKKRKKTIYFIILNDIYIIFENLFIPVELKKYNC
jgi:hypothetical protein